MNLYSHTVLHQGKGGSQEGCLQPIEYNREHALEFLYFLKLNSTKLFFCISKCVKRTNSELRADSDGVVSRPLRRIGMATIDWNGEQKEGEEPFRIGRFEVIMLAKEAEGRSSGGILVPPIHHPDTTTEVCLAYRDCFSEWVERPELIRFMHLTPALHDDESTITVDD